MGYSVTREVTLTANQPAQWDALNDWEGGSILYQGGFGSGKTWVMARKFLMLHEYNRGSKGLVTAPTYGDLWRLCVPEMEAALNEWGWKYEIFPGGRKQCKFPHMIVCGRIIYLLSAEKPESITGFEVGHVWVDEAARLKTNAAIPTRDAPTQIRARMRDKKAKVMQLLCSTTPEGQDTWIHRDWFKKPIPRHRAYIGSTLKNKHLPQEYIDDLQVSLASNLLDQYLHGHAANLIKGQAHPTFSKVLNVSKRAKFRDNAMLHIGQDFNVQPMAWVAGHQIGKEIHIVDEIFIEDFALVDNAMQEAQDKEWGIHKVWFHPDKASKNRNTTSDPEFDQCVNFAKEFEWNYRGGPDGVNPDVNHRINNVSRAICNGVGDRSLIIHPRCKHLIDDLENTTRKQASYNPGPDGMRGHILDALGYLIWDILRPHGKIEKGKVG